MAQPSLPPKMLVIDYAMGYPEENAGVMSIFTEAGFQVDYRQYYPALVERDASVYDAIVLMGGGDPGMSLQEVDFAINFVSRGKLLILAVPPDTEYGGKRRVNAGVHDRYMFNRVLNRLNIPLYAFAPTTDEGAALTPVLMYETPPGHPVGEGITGPLRMRAATRLLIGDGAEPLLVEPESEEPSVAEASPEKQPPVRMKRRSMRIQPGNALPDEDIELILRGANDLRVWLHYGSGRPPVPADWNTTQVKGRVTAVSEDTVTVRVPGNRWGSEYALVGIPAAITATTFVQREMPEEIKTKSGSSEEVNAQLAGAGRTALMAVGRGDRLNKGFVMVTDRGVMNHLSAPGAPVSLVGADLPEPARTARFLTQVSRYLAALTSSPDSWAPSNPYPSARIPGIQESKFPLNNIKMLPSLPERVTFITNRTRPVDLMNATPARTPASPMRGAWEFISRSDTGIDTLLSVMRTLPLNFLWTVAPALSFTAADSTALAAASQFKTWGTQVGNRLAGSAVQWFAGVRTPEKVEGSFVQAVDARGEETDMPSPLDREYWDKYVFAPSRSIAQLSRNTGILTGIVHDWETHVSRVPRAYAPTDAFHDELFRQYLSHLAHYGFYRGDEFNSAKNLSGKQRFEWLLKSGRLEDYMQFLESRAERLGQMYRASIDAVNAALLHGAFMRTPRLSWFHLGFWRGMSNPERPFLLLTYERTPDWYTRLLRDRGITVRPIPMALLGYVDGAAYTQVLQETGDYCLERGVWLVSEPENTQDFSAPQRQGLTGPQAVEAIRRVGW